MQLFPATTQTLVEGVAMLDKMNSYLEKQIASNAKIRESMPKGASEAFASQVKSIRDASQILATVGQLFQVPEAK